MNWLCGIWDGKWEMEDGIGSCRRLVNVRRDAMQSPSPQRRVKVYEQIKCEDYRRLSTWATKNHVATNKMQRRRHRADERPLVYVGPPKALCPRCTQLKPKKGPAAQAGPQSARQLHSTTGYFAKICDKMRIERKPRARLM